MNLNESMEPLTQSSQNPKIQVSSSDIENLVKIGQDLVDIAGNTPDLKTKLKSRKFFVCIAGIVAGILGMLACPENTVAIIVFAIVELGSVIGYIIAEGYIDATRAKELLAAIGTIGSMVASGTTGNATFCETRDDAGDSVESEEPDSGEPDIEPDFVDPANG